MKHNHHIERKNSAAVIRRMIAVVALLGLVLTLLVGCQSAKISDPLHAASESVPAAASRGGPLLWRVTDGEGHTMYLFGTMHAGANQNDTILEELRATLDTCDALAVEFDVVAFQNDAAAVQEMLPYMLYLDGTKIQDHVSEAQYDAMVELTTRAGTYNQLMDYYNLASWSELIEQSMITLATDLKLEKAFDSMLIHYAYEHGTPVLEVESAELQYSLLAAFPEETYLLLLDEALSRDEAAYGEQLTGLYTAWRTGDEASLSELLQSSSTDELTPEQQALIDDYNRKMLDDRNLGMRDKAIEYLQSGQTVFFAVGTAHMLGDAGLVRLLTDAGYTVELLPWS